MLHDAFRMSQHVRWNIESKRLLECGVVLGLSGKLKLLSAEVSLLSYASDNSKHQISTIAHHHRPTMRITACRTMHCDWSSLPC